MYTWMARFKGGETLLEYDPVTGEQQSLPKCDRANLTEVILFDHDRITPIVRQRFQPGQRLIYRRRRRLNSDGTPVADIIVLGWAMTIIDVAGQRREVRHVGFYDEAGTIVLGDYMPQHVVMAPPEENAYDQIPVA